MKNTFQTLIVAFVGLLFLPNLAFGQLYEVSFDEKIQKSTLIVEGKVVESRCYRADNDNIYTANKIKLSALLKGDYRNEYLTVITWGGELDGEQQTWTHMLTLEKGNYGVFFLEPTQLQSISFGNLPESFDVYSGVQGFLAFAQNDAKAWVAYEPFRTYSDIENDIYGPIARTTGQGIVNVNEESAVPRSGVRYHFTDIGFDGTSVTFSVYVNSLIGTKKLYNSGIQIGYNPAFFGASLATNGNLLLQAAGISQSSAYNLTQSNTTSSKVKIELVPVGTLTGLTTIGSTEQLLAKGKMTIQNILADPGITYDITEMQSMSKYYEGGTAQLFDTVIVEGDWRLFEQFAPQIENIAPLSLRAGTDDVLTITGTGFGSTQGSSYVLFTNAYAGTTNGVDWIQPLAGDYISWTATEIKVIVPSIGLGTGSGSSFQYAGTGKVRVRVGGSTATSNQTLTVRLAADNRALIDAGNPIYKRKKVRLIGDFGEFDGYTLYYNQNFKNLNGAIPAFERALCTWVQSSNINFRIKEYSDIGIDYQPTACQILLTNSLPTGTGSSTKAITTKDYFGGCQDGNGNVIKVSLKKFDIYFRQSANWYLSQQYDPTLPFSFWEANQDLESFAIHELGHAQLLLHVNQTADVMYYEILTPNRSLHSGDIEGANYIKGISIVNEPGCTVHPIIPNSDCGLIPTFEIGKELQLYLYPNPVKNQLIIEGPNQIQELKIFNNLGMLVMESVADSKISVSDVSKLNAGFYFALVKNNNKYYSLKFEKI